jgi:Skp family chaperone for outer membrane proteins
MKKIILGAAFSALALGVPGVAHAQKAPAAVVVVVDTDRIYRECTACVAAQTQLQALVTSSRNRAQELGQPLQTERQSLEEAAQALRNQTGAARTSGETALNTRLQAFQQKQTAAQQELAQLEQNIQSTQAHVLRQINERLDPIYSQVMTARNANLAVDTNATLAHAATLDVTNQVLAQLNAALPSVSVTPLPAPPAATPAQQPQPTR